MSSKTRTIDINSDVGERPSALMDGSEELLIRIISSANIACGGHAGDRDSMRKVVRMCLAHGVIIGVHPSYPDRDNFGRSRFNLPASELEASVRTQVGTLIEVAASVGATVRHVKPHGALYNAAVTDRETAIIIARAIAALDRNLTLVGLAGSSMLAVWADAGFAVVGEAFADRRYEADGTLRPRGYSDAVIASPGEAAQQALQIAQEGIITAVNGTRLPVVAQTICIHSDTENALSIAEEVRRALEAAGVVVGPF